MKYKLTKLMTLAGVLAISLNTVAQNTKDRNSHPDRDEHRGPPPFCVLDSNDDGFISLEEFKQHKIPQGDHETVFSNIDIDSDGFITEQELSDHKPPRPERNKS